MPFQKLGETFPLLLGEALHVRGVNILFDLSMVDDEAIIHGPWAHRPKKTFFFGKVLAHLLSPAFQKSIETSFTMRSQSPSVFECNAVIPSKRFKTGMTIHRRSPVRIVGQPLKIPYRIADLYARANGGLH